MIRSIAAESVVEVTTQGSACCRIQLAYFARCLAVGSVSLNVFTFGSRDSARGVVAEMFRRMMLPSAIVSRPLALHVIAGWRVASTASAIEEKQCLLCDEDYEEWSEHARSRRHRARHAVCSALVNPDKHTAIMQQIWEHIRLDFNLVDEINAKKVRRRRGRLSSTLGFLRDSDVVKHAFFQYDEERGRWAASKHLPKFVALGESELRFQVTDRVARLFPKSSLTELSVISQMVLHLTHIEDTYDFLEMDKLLMAPSTLAASPLQWSPQQKGAMLLAMIGELHEFLARDRPHSVGTKEMADALVLNVLATHAVENVVSEIVHYVLQKIVDEGTPVWKEYKAQLPSLVMQSSRSKRALLPLSATPEPRPSPEAAQSVEDARRLSALNSEPPESGLGTRAETPVAVKPSMHHLIRSCARAVTVPNPVTPRSFYADCAPKLSHKAPPVKPKSGV